MGTKPKQYEIDLRPWCENNNAIGENGVDLINNCEKSSDWHAKTFLHQKLDDARKKCIISLSWRITWWGAIRGHRSRSHFPQTKPICSARAGSVDASRLSESSVVLLLFNPLSQLPCISQKCLSVRYSLVDVLAVKCEEFHASRTRLGGQKECMFAASSSLSGGMTLAAGRLRPFWVATEEGRNEMQPRFDLSERTHRHITRAGFYPASSAQKRPKFK